MAQPIMSAAALSAWLHMLDQVEESIAAALRDVAEHERALDAAETAGLSDEQPHGLVQFDERLRTLRSHLDAADDVAAQIEELLTEDEREARAWLSGAATARRRLAGAGAV